MASKIDLAQFLRVPEFEQNNSEWLRRRAQPFLEAARELVEQLGEEMDSGGLSGRRAAREIAILVNHFRHLHDQFSPGRARNEDPAYDMFQRSLDSLCEELQDMALLRGLKLAREFTKLQRQDPGPFLRPR